MKLTRVDLRSFRSYQGVSLNMDAPKVLVAGLNGVGKSSLRDAIRWGLLGHCQGTDARGAGSDVLIPSGQKVAEVGIAIDTIGVATRTFTESAGGSFTVDAFTGTSQIQQQALLLQLNTTPAFLDAVLDTSVFLDLNHVDAKALVLSLLDVRISVDAALLPHKAAEAGTVDLTLDELEVTYKQAFEDRKAAKKVLQNCAVPEKPTDAQMPTIEAIDAQLTKLRAALGVARQGIGSVTGRRMALEQEMARLAPALGAADPLPDHTEAIATLETSIAALEAEVAPPSPVAPAKGDPARVMFLRSRADAIGKHLPKAGCVLDSEIPCKTAQGQFSERQKALEAELKGLAPDTSALPAEPAASPLTVARKQLSVMQWEQAKADSAAKALAEATARTQAIRQELDGLPSTAAQEAEIATLEGRIEKGATLLTQARTHWSAVEGYAKAVRAQQAAKAEVDRLEALVEALGPKGARVAALATAMGTFEAAVNPYLRSFGWTLSFEVEPWQALANGRPVETYSKSERFRIGIALQMGIALLSGLKFAVIDETDMLDVANRQAVTKMLMSAPLDQILVLGTREPSQPLPAAREGLIAYRLAKEGDRTVVAEVSAVELVGA